MGVDLVDSMFNLFRELTVNWDRPGEAIEKLGEQVGTPFTADDGTVYAMVRWRGRYYAYKKSDPLCNPIDVTMEFERWRGNMYKGDEYSFDFQSIMDINKR